MINKLLITRHAELVSASFQLTDPETSSG